MKTAFRKENEETPTKKVSLHCSKVTLSLERSVTQQGSCSLAGEQHQPAADHKLHLAPVEHSALRHLLSADGTQPSARKAHPADCSDLSTFNDLLLLMYKFQM